MDELGVEVRIWYMVLCCIGAWQRWLNRRLWFNIIIVKQHLGLVRHWTSGLPGGSLALLASIHHCTFIGSPSKHIICSFRSFVKNKVLTQDLHVWLKLVIINHLLGIHNTNIHARILDGIM